MKEAWLADRWVLLYHLLVWPGSYSCFWRRIVQKFLPTEIVWWIPRPSSCRNWKCYMSKRFARIPLQDCPIKIKKWAKRRDEKEKTEWSWSRVWAPTYTVSVKQGQLSSPFCLNIPQESERIWGAEQMEMEGDEAQTSHGSSSFNWNDDSLLAGRCYLATLTTVYKPSTVWWVCADGQKTSIS